MEIVEFILSVIASLTASVIHSLTGLSQLSYLKKKKIENRINNALIVITEPLIPFFEKEGIAEEKQYFLMETCR